MRETVGIVLLLGIFLVLGFGIGWCAMEVHTEDQQEELSRQGRQVQAKLDALRSANRLHIAFWRTKEELEAEAIRYRRGGDR